MERMTRWLAAVALLAAVPAASPAPAQAPAPVTETGPVPGPVADDMLALGETSERMTVPVAIAGAGPFPFIIDTGAQRSVVSRQLAARLGLPAGRRVRIVAMSGVSDADTVIVPSLSVSPPSAGDASRGIGAARIEAPALDARHLGALGLLGIDTLQGHAVAIDFDRGQMAVVASTRRARRRPRAADEIVIEARSLFGQLVVTDATVAGRRVRVVLDTGTAVSMGNNALRRLLARKGDLGDASLVSVTGEAVAAQYAIVRALTFGSATIAALPVAFADVAPFRAFGIEDKPAMLLGMDALRLFRRVEIDFANRQLRLVLPRR